MEKSQVLSNKTQKCPFCQEEIKEKANKCKYCLSNVTSIKPDHEGVCPFCKEEIKEAAIKCKHCRSNLIGESITPIRQRINLRSNLIGESITPIRQRINLRKFRWGRTPPEDIRARVFPEDLFAEAKEDQCAKQCEGSGSSEQFRWCMNWCLIGIPFPSEPPSPPPCPIGCFEGWWYIFPYPYLQRICLCPQIPQILIVD